MSKDIVIKDEVPTVAFMNKTNTRRIEDDEKELEKLIKENNGIVDEEEKEPEEELVEPTSVEEKTFKKRYSDLRRHAQRKEEELSNRIKDLESRGPSELPIAREAVEQWVSEYPDVAAIVQTLSKDTYADQAKSLETRMADIERRDSELSMKEMESKIRSAHSDYDTIKEDAAFHDWADKQPSLIQDALYDNVSDPASVIRVLDLYKSDTGVKTKAKPKRSAAESIRTRGDTAQPTTDRTDGAILESDVEKMTSREYSANEDAILESIKAGTFVYDVSGG